MLTGEVQIQCPKSDRNRHHSIPLFFFFFKEAPIDIDINKCKMIMEEKEHPRKNGKPKEDRVHSVLLSAINFCVKNTSVYIDA